MFRLVHRGTTRRILAAGAAAVLLPLSGLAVAPALPAAGAQPISAECAAVSNGSAHWGIKESFRSYLKSPIAMGGWNLDGVGFSGAEAGADGTFDFTADAPKASVNGQDADIPLNGSMTLHGHFDLLKINLTNMSIKVRGSEAQFIADFSSNTVNRPAPGAEITGQEQGTQAAIATFTLDQPIDANAVRSGKFNLSGAGYITEDGNRAFGGNYGEGNNTTDRLNMDVSTIPGLCVGGELDELGKTAPAAGQAPAEPHTDDAPPALDVAPATQNASRSTGGNAASHAAPKNYGKSTPAPAGKEASALSGSGEVCREESTKGVSDARMGWGVKDSFRTYVQGGVAKGGWTTSGGAVYNSGAFVFSGSDGAVDPSSPQGSINYGGSVNFTGHGGVLDLTLANPEITFSGNSGSLIADVTSNDTEGNPRSFGRITVADLAVSASVSGDVIDGNAGATLTAAGSEALADFYPAGTAMAPVTFKASLSGSASCSAAGGSNAPSSGNAGGKSEKSGKSAALEAMPEDETPKDAKPVADKRSSTSLLDNAASTDDDPDTVAMALASNPGMPIAGAMLVIAAGVLLYRIGRNRRAVPAAADSAATTGSGEN
ncbi:HtaA domain-containing protein [Dietzia timorensis]|uniref:Htaa domain-containing protein n=1 Tax=Dietzia timorensis TaxID=499555 RepID=A0A173LIY8_9ACTN|nr:HtaA domain-containing protein [Dietzia timorensis]ANI91237.1 Hypothetical protein BJL86_0427 [Dietzia timorensis]